MKTERTCPFCQNEFKPHHGNQLYCSIECKKYQKAAVQLKLYGLLKEFRKGFLANYKLLERLLPKPGDKIFLLAELNNSGFKPNCYYGAFRNEKKETLFSIAEYQFLLFFENQNNYIKIIKNKL